MDERRSSARRDTALVGRIVCDKRRAPIECTVRDLSDDGARIEVREEALLPYEFELEVPDMSLSVRTRVAWTSGKGYGLLFIGTPQMVQDQSSSSEPAESAPLSEIHTRPLTLHLPEAQYERLRRVAFEQRLSYQELIERALRTYLNQ
jgi:hypothetical protein